MRYEIWTYEKCKADALKYKTRRDFAINSGSAYNYARQNNIINKVTEHMSWGRKPSGYWTYERCGIEALKYETRNEYRLKSGGSYMCAIKNKWIDDICIHMKIVGNRRKRLIYSYEFSDNHVYVGLTYDINQRQTVRNNDENDSVTQHIKKTKLIPQRIQLTKYVDVIIASKLEGLFLEKYVNDGWHILNKRKTGNIGGNYCRWDKKACINVAQKCKTKKEFYSKYRCAYDSALRNGWISEIYETFNSTQQKRNYYTFDFCESEALKYRTKKEFKNKNRGAYEASLRNGWISEICNHMINANTFRVLESIK